MKLAPIVLFVYNRPDHTGQTIKYLQNNILAKNTDLFIFSDAPKRESDRISVEKVRSLIKDIKGFNSVNIIEREINYGLAKSIMTGVTDVVNKFGKVIVLEDDIITSKFFLSYMNDSLNMYKEDDSVMHISGYFYPGANNLPSNFFYNQTSCWGWGTWDRAWSKFDSNVEKLIKESSKVRNKKNGYFKIALSQLRANKRGEINTWGARWQMSILLNNGFCLHSNPSFTQNIGHDGSGVNCGICSDYDSNLVGFYEEIEKINIKENILAVEHGNNFLERLKPSILKRILFKIKYLLFRVGKI